MIHDIMPQDSRSVMTDIFLYSRQWKQFKTVNTKGLDVFSSLTVACGWLCHQTAKMSKCLQNTVSTAENKFLSQVVNIDRPLT